MQDPDVRGLATRIAECGGRQVKDVWKIFPDQDYEMTYCADPFGNFIEIHSHGYEHGHANIPEYY